MVNNVKMLDAHETARLQWMKLANKTHKTWPPDCKHRSAPAPDPPNGFNGFRQLAQ